MLQHPQRSSKLEQRQLLKQRRQAVEIRRQEQDLSGTPMKARIQDRVQDRSPHLKPQSRQVQEKGMHAVRSRRARYSNSNVRMFPVASLPDQRPFNQVPSNQRHLAQRLSSHQKFRWLKNCLKLGFMGLGLSAVAGTAITILHPVPRPGTLARSLSQTDPKSAGGSTTQNSFLDAGSIATSPVLFPDQELKEVEAKILALAGAQAGLTPGVFVYNPDTGAYLDIAADKAFSAASTIKFPVLVAFFQDIDANRINLDELLLMRKDLVAPESGDMQYQPVGTKFSALETATLMITISDNTATNMLIDRLGGATALNQRFKAWGLTQTVIRNPLPDLQGTNTISPRDLSVLMLKVGQGELLTPHSRDRALDMMRNTVTNTLLSPGLGEGAKISHKTGDIGSVVGDVGMIEMPSGQRYVATAMVQRPHNDPRAQELIRQTSRLIYQSQNQTGVGPQPGAAPEQPASPATEPGAKP